MPKPLSTEGQAVDSFLNEGTETLSYLYERWQDEREYENINDYAKPLTALATKHGLKIEKMNKRPFGCDVSINNRKFRVDVTARSMGWKEIR